MSFAGEPPKQQLSDHQKQLVAEMVEKLRRPADVPPTAPDTEQKTDTENALSD